MLVGSSSETERVIEELNVELQYAQPISSSGAVLTLSAAVADLKGCLDGQAMTLVPHDDWAQVMKDFGASVDETGPKVARLVGSTAQDLLATLPNLISSDEPRRNSPQIPSALRRFVPQSIAGEVERGVDALVKRLHRRALRSHRSGPYRINDSARTHIIDCLAKLDQILRSDEAIIAAWLDLRKSVEKLNRSVEEVSFRRDVLYAIASNRQLDMESNFGVFSDLRRLLADSADAVVEAQALANGAPYERPLFPTEGPSGAPGWERLQLCEQFLRQSPPRGDCVVWLLIAPATVPNNEVSHGQVTFYNAAVIGSSIGHPEVAKHFKTPPLEVLADKSALEIAATWIADDVDWRNDWRAVYARVELGDIEIHTAESRARALVDGLKAVNHPEPGTWNVLDGRVVFVDGGWRSSAMWAHAEKQPDLYQPQNDRMALDVELMSHNRRSLDAKSLDDLGAAIRISASLKEAVKAGPEPTVMAAVRAIEHVNVWTTGGRKNWADFASDYFKKAQCRSRLIGFLDYYTVRAIVYCRPLDPTEARLKERYEIRRKIMRPVGAHDVHDRRASAANVPALQRLYQGHWLSRGLGELSVTLSDGKSMFTALETHGRRFDLQLGRLKRCRNAAIHGGVVSDAACQSVATFASRLAHHCLNEAMRAMLEGREISSALEEFRNQGLEKHNRIRAAGDINEFFVAQVYDPWGQNDSQS